MTQVEERIARLEAEVGARHEHLASKSDIHEQGKSFLWIVVVILLALSGWMAALILTLMGVLGGNS